MLVVSRFEVGQEAGEGFLARAEAALAALGARPGYAGGRVGRAIDDPTRWVMVTEWEGVGAYRRALSDYAVKLAASPLLGESVYEPSAYEVLSGEDGRRTSDRAGG